MSKKTHSNLANEQRAFASIFAALGDQTRLLLIAELCRGQPRSISQLTENTKLTRQAITKHLRVLECVGMVYSVRQGRESLFEFRAEPLKNRGPVVNKRGWTLLDRDMGRTF